MLVLDGKPVTRKKGERGICQLSLINCHLSSEGKGTKASFHKMTNDN